MKTPLQWLRIPGLVLALGISSLLLVCPQTNTLAGDGGTVDSKSLPGSQEQIVLPDCTDTDGDGYVTCSGCVAPSGTSCGDCAEGNAAVHPGASETCNGVDDDCNGVIDDGFTFDGVDPNNQDPDNDGTIGGPLVLGEACAIGRGDCYSVGSVVCRGDGTAAICNAAVIAPGTENNGGTCLSDSKCADHRDNDCDGLTDYADPDCQCTEICDGLDNDGDGTADNGFGLGATCTVGVGQCQNSGKVVCKTLTTTKCDATEFAGSPENTPGVGACTDGIDNDCDGSIDLADPSCQEPEKCDGKDNDGDGTIDNGAAFADLGQTCYAGVGACLNSGTIVCTPDGTATTCGAVPKTGSPEGPAGTTCTDGKDNDCDGFTDAADNDCSSANIFANCSLPYVIGLPGSDCNGWHTVRFSTGGGGAGAKVTAEFVGLDLQGNVIGTVNPKNGERVHTASRLDQADWKVDTKRDSKGTFHEVFAPIPLLKVTIDDGKNSATAYCSNIPYLDIFKPSSSDAVSESEGDKTDVEVAVPRVSAKSIAIKLDCVDIVPALGLNPLTAFPGGPYAGTVTIGGDPVKISNLIVDIAPNIGTMKSNTVRFTAEGLGGGGHKVIVTGVRQPGSLPNPLTPQCDMDDINDSAVSAVLAVGITAPTPLEEVAGPDTHVLGSAKHGKHINAVRLNGRDLDVSGQSFVPAGSSCLADSYAYTIDELVPETDLKTEYDTGTPVVGSFDPGSNRLVAQATDDNLVTAFRTFFFSVGPVHPVPTASIQPVGGNGTDAEWRGEGGIDAWGHLTHATPVSQRNQTDTDTDVDKAFTLALDPTALTTFFSASCDSVKADLASKIEGGIEGYSKTQVQHVACDPNVTTSVVAGTANVDPNGFNCAVTPQDHQIHVEIGVPNIDFQVRSTGHCEDDDPVFGICLLSLDIDKRMDVHMSGMKILFDVTETNILNKTQVTPTVVPPDNLTTSDPGLDVPGYDIGCIAGFFIDAINFLTFGLVDLTPEVTVPTQTEDLAAKLGLVKGDPFTLDLVKPTKPEDLPAFGLTMQYNLSDVKIDPNGLAAAYKAKLTSTFVDPEVANVTGSPITDADLPRPIVHDAKGGAADDLTIAVSDDMFNQLFAGLTRAGKLKTLFQDVKPLGSYLPSDCNTLTTAEGRAFCKGVKCANQPAGCCTGLPSDEGVTCAAINILFKLKNLNVTTPIILHGRVDNPPKLEIDDDHDGTVDSPVNVHLRMSQTSVDMIADRDGDGTHVGTLESVQPCFKTGVPTSGECSLWEACANLDFLADMTLDSTVQDGQTKPVIKTDVRELNYSVSTGMLCGGGTDSDSDSSVQIDTISGSQIFSTLENDTQNSTPNLVSDGLTLGNLVKFKDARLIAIDIGPVPDGFDDYIAITGRLEKATP